MSQLKNLRTSLVLVALLAATPSFAGDGEITGFIGGLLAETSTRLKQEMS